MFGIGMTELLVILVVALVVLGPSRLPDVARSIGRAVSELRRQSADILDEFQAQDRTHEVARRPKRPAAPSPQAAPATPPAPAPAETPGSDQA